MPNFESRRCFEHIDKLAYEIGPREAGSRGDIQAANYIRQVFKNINIPTKFKEFGFVNKVIYKKVRASILAITFILTLFFNPLQSLLITLTGLTLAYFIPKLIPKKQSQNVIATLKPENDVKNRLILGAHYDSAVCVKDQKCIIYYRILLPIVSIFFIILVFLRFIDLMPIRWEFTWILLGVFILPSCILPFYMYENFVSPGANDNASGTAVILELARVISETPLDNTEVLFIAFGAEEQGLIGSREYVSKGIEVSTIINLDSIGAGSQLSLIQGNGVIRKHFTSPLLNNKILRTSKKIGSDINSIWAPFSVHDHIPFLKKGVIATTISSSDLSSKNRLDKILERRFNLPNVQTQRDTYLHSIDDVPENIKLENIEAVGKLIMNTIEDYDGN